MCFSMDTQVIPPPLYASGSLVLFNNKPTTSLIYLEDIVNLVTRCQQLTTGGSVGRKVNSSGAQGGRNTTRFLSSPIAHLP
jgi:hypothetical protein